MTTELPQLKTIKGEPRDYEELSKNYINNHPCGMDFKSVTTEASSKTRKRASFSDSGYSSSSSDTASPVPTNIQQQIMEETTCRSPVSQNNGNEISEKVKKPERECHVCGEAAHGNFFGAVVCLPCKTFFIRCTTEDTNNFVCRQGNGSCNINGIHRSRCKYCRYKKCLMHGMNRKERPEQVTVQEGQQLCNICNDVANGVHFGVISCEGCKKFFRRGLRESESYVCKLGGHCSINPRTRNDCRYCRFQKCLALGMSTSAIRMGRPRKSSDMYVSRKLSTGDRKFDKGSDSQPEISPTTMSDSYNEQMPNYTHMLIPQNSHAPLLMQQYSSHASADLVNKFKNTSPSHQLVNKQQLKHTLLSRKRSNDSEHMNPLFGPSQDMLCDDMEQPPVKKLMNNLSLHSMNYNQMIPKAHKLTVKDDKQTRRNESQDSHSKDLITIKQEDSDYQHTLEIKGLKIHSSNHQSDTLKHHSDKNNLSELELMRESPGTLAVHNFNGKCRHKNTIMSDCQEMLVNTLSCAYLELLEVFCREIPISQDTEEGDQAKRKVIHYISAAICYMRKVPAFSKLHERDQYTILRLGAFQVCAVVASIHLYNPFTHCFIKSFFEAECGEKNYQFSEALLDLSRQVHSFNLDNMESAFLCAILTIAADWSDLEMMDKIKDLRNDILSTFKTYIKIKYGEKSERLDNIFSLIPSIRKIGIWHYKLSYESTFF